MSGIAGMLAECGVRAPVRVVGGELGVIVDADGRDFATIDVNNEREDVDVAVIAALVADAINAACAPAAPPRPPLIDLRTAPSLMEQRYGGGR